MFRETEKLTVQTLPAPTQRAMGHRAGPTRLAAAIAAIGLIGSMAGCASGGGHSADSSSCLLGTWDLDFASSADPSASETTTGDYTMIFEVDTVTVNVDVSSSMTTVVDGVDTTIDQVITGSAKQEYSVHGTELTYGDVVWTKGSGTTTIEKDGETTTEENDFAPTSDVTVDMRCENDQLVLTSAPESETTAEVATVEQIFTRR
jgi:hypothetical protein